MMKTNPILDEIRAVRDKHARAMGNDVHQLFSALRAETEQFKKQGLKVVSYDNVSKSDLSVVREDSPAQNG